MERSRNSSLPARARHLVRLGLVTAGVTAVVLGTASAGFASVQPVSRPCAQPDGRVAASVVSSGVLYFGGSFTHVVDRNGTSSPRGGLAAVDMTTCDLLPWTADTNGIVYALTASADTVYAGGTFTSVGGQPRNRLAAVASLDGTVLPFNPNVNKMVRALTISGTTLYAGGMFTKVSGVNRGSLAAFDRGSGALSSAWTPNTSGVVRALASSADSQRIYVGGLFTSLDGNPSYPYLGAVDAGSGAIYTGFNAGATFPILSLAADTSGVYAGGGGTGGHVMVMNPDGSLQRPVYQTDGDVQAIAVAGDSVYAGGHFDNYCLGNTGSGAPFICDSPLKRRKLLEVSLVTGDVTGWAPRLNSSLGVHTESVDPVTGDLYLGGDFTTVNSLPQARLATFRAATSIA
jgi:hypothetical protein